MPQQADFVQALPVSSSQKSADAALRTGTGNGRAAYHFSLAAKPRGPQQIADAAGVVSLRTGLLEGRLVDHIELVAARFAADTEPGAANLTRIASRKQRFQLG